MILIHPPVVKPCESPAGLAKLAGALNHHNIPHTIIDANREGVADLLVKSGRGLDCTQREAEKDHVEAGVGYVSDRWTNRSVRNLESNLAALTSWQTYRNIDRYKRAVLDVNRVLAMSASKSGVRLGIANYQDQRFSPLRSTDLIGASEIPDHNPFFPYFKRRLLTVLESKGANVAGFSLNYLSQAICTFAMIGFLKREIPGIRIILGGGLVTSWVRQPGWSNPFKGLVDDMVDGPGESELLSIHGMTYQEGYTEPDYSVLSMEGYLAPGPILSYSASSGCYWSRCSFCPERAEGNPYIPVPVDRVMTDLHNLTERTKPVLVHLLDNALSPVLLKTLAASSFCVPWYGFARISSHLTDLDFCLALKRSGCVMLQLGLESGDQNVLDTMQKGFDLETASLALKTLKKAGIATYVYLLFGTPAETIVEARKTLDFTAKHSNQIDFLNLAIFNLPVHSPEAQEFETSEFYEGDLSLYRSFSHPKGWGRNFVRQFLDREFKRHPAIAMILRKVPPIFTSNHAPFFVMRQ